MSISVTVSGDGSTQVTQSSAQNQSIIVSGGSTNTITATPASSSSVIVTETPDVGSSLPSSFAPALAAQSSALANLQRQQAGALEDIDRQLKNLTGTTDTLNTQIASNTSSITGVLTGVSDFTGTFDQKIDLISGSVNTISGLANASNSAVIQSADNTLQIVSLQSDSSLLLTKTSNISGYITGVVNPLVEKTGDFAVTGSDVTFKDVIISGDLLPSNSNASLGNPSNRFRDIHLSSDSIYLGNSKISFEGTPSGVSGGLRVLAAGMSGRLLENTETGVFAATGSDVTFKNVLVSESILPENTGASLGSPTGRFKDLHLSENSIFLGDSKISFSGGASGGLTITGSGLLTTGGQAKVIKLLGEDDEGRIAVQSSLEVGRNIFLGDEVNDAKIKMQGPGPVNYSFVTHADGFRLTDGDGGGGVLINVPHSFYDSDGTRRTMTLTDTSVQGQFFTSSGVHHSADPDTAFLFPDNNTTSILTSGVERLRVNKSGKLGIGSGFRFQAVQPSRLVHIKTHTTDDDGQHPLRIEGASSSILELKAGDNTSLVGIDFSDNAAPHPGSIVYNHSNNSMAFDTNDATRMTISDSGHVIITGDLTVASGINIGTETVLTSGQTQTNIDTAVSNLVDSAPATLNTLNELAAALGDDANFSTTTATSLGNLSTATGNLNTRVNSNDSDISALNTATGLLNTNVNTVSGLITSNDSDISALQAVTGSFAQTGSSTFGLLNVTGNVGIGTTSPDTQLHIKSAGDVSLKLEADTDNTNESHNPLMQFIQDGGLISANVGFNGGTNTEFTNAIDNAFYIENTSSAGGFGAIQFASNNQAQLTILSGGNVGIGTNAPSAKLHVAGDTIMSGGNLQIGSTPAYSPTRAIKVHDNGVQFGARVTLVGTNDNGGPGLEMVTDGSLSKRTIIRHEGEGSNDYGLAFFTTNNGTTSEKVRFDGNGGVGIGTSSVTAGKKLDVNGDIKVVGIEASEVNVKDADGYFIENKQFAKFENNTLKLGDHDGESFTTDIFGNGGIPMIRITGDGSQAANTFLGIGTTAPQAKLHVNGSAIVSGGLTTLGKTTLSSDAFVTETGSFTLGATHKGATVLLQNSTSINITVPAQASGYITTFIAETHNSVSFITGVGMSGLNSFNGASDIAGIYGQAQVIYKSAEYAFLGGNVV